MIPALTALAAPCATLAGTLAASATAAAPACLAVTTPGPALAGALAAPAPLALFIAPCAGVMAAPASLATVAGAIAAPATLAAVAVPAVAIGVVFTHATVAPASPLWGTLISRGPAGSNRVALTFDDGPTPGTTERVLDALAAADARAAFFVIGASVQRHPDLLRRIHAEGHLVANHSYSHSHYTFFHGPRTWEREIRRTDDVIESILGVRPRLFRPPMGVKTWNTTLARRRTGHTIVTWSRRAIDGLPTTAARIAKRFANTTDGEILLLHDGVEPHAPCSDRTATIAAVPALIQSLRARHLTLVRLDELLGIDPYAPRAGATPPSP
jgi:peptidoglycan/xylan/chitin deacetylase (PgdA/CDA1 family)